MADTTRGPKPALVWETLRCEMVPEERGVLTGPPVPVVRRAAVPGGWLVYMGARGGVAFYPDPHHEWDGGSPPWAAPR